MNESQKSLPVQVKGVKDKELCTNEECECQAITDHGTVCGEPQSLKILDELNKLYQESLSSLDNTTTGDATQIKLKTLASWVNDLGEQNAMLVHTVEQLEKEATKRVALLEERLQRSSHVALEYMTKLQDFDNQIQEVPGEKVHSESIATKASAQLHQAQKREGKLRMTIACLQSDIIGLLELVRRARQDGSWDIDGLNFHEISYDDIFRTSSDKSPVTVQNQCPMLQASKPLHEDKCDAFTMTDALPEVKHWENHVDKAEQEPSPGMQDMHTMQDKELWIAHMEASLNELNGKLKTSWEHIYTSCKDTPKDTIENHQVLMETEQSAVKTLLDKLKDVLNELQQQSKMIESLDTINNTLSESLDMSQSDVKEARRQINDFELTITELHQALKQAPKISEQVERTILKKGVNFAPVSTDEYEERIQELQKELKDAQNEAELSKKQTVRKDNKFCWEANDILHNFDTEFHGGGTAFHLKEMKQSFDEKDDEYLMMVPYYMKSLEQKSFQLNELKHALEIAETNLGKAEEKLKVTENKLELCNKEWEKRYNNLSNSHKEYQNKCYLLELRLLEALEQTQTKEDIDLKFNDFQQLVQILRDDLQEVDYELKRSCGSLMQREKSHFWHLMGVKSEEGNIQQLRSEVEKLKSVLTDKESVIKHQKEMLSIQQETLNVSQNEVVELQEQLSRLEKVNEDESKLVQEQLHTISQLQQALLSARKELEEGQNKDCSEVVKQAMLMELLRDANVDLQVCVFYLKQEVGHLECQLADSLQTLKMEKVNFENLKKENEELKSKWYNMEIEGKKRLQIRQQATCKTFENENLHTGCDVTGQKIEVEPIVVLEEMQPRYVLESTSDIRRKLGTRKSLLEDRKGERKENESKGIVQFQKVSGNVGESKIPLTEFITTENLKEKIDVLQYQNAILEKKASEEGLQNSFHSIYLKELHIILDAQTEQGKRNEENIAVLKINFTAVVKYCHHMEQEVQKLQELLTNLQKQTEVNEERRSIVQKEVENSRNAFREIKEKLEKLNQIIKEKCSEITKTGSGESTKSLVQCMDGTYVIGSREQDEVLKLRQQITDLEMKLDQARENYKLVREEQLMSVTRREVGFQKNFSAKEAYLLNKVYQTENENLKILDTVQMLTWEIQKLVSQIDDRESQLQGTTDILRDLSQDTTNWQKEVMQKEFTVQKLQEKLSQSNIRLKKVFQHIGEKELLIQKLNNENEELQGHLRKLESQVPNNKPEQYFALQNEVLNLKVEIQELLQLQEKSNAEVREYWWWDDCWQIW